jgi:hypothetical protein
MQIYTENRKIKQKQMGWATSSDYITPFPEIQMLFRYIEKNKLLYFDVNFISRGRHGKERMRLAKTNLFKFLIYVHLNKLS